LELAHQVGTGEHGVVLCRAEARYVTATREAASG